MEVGHVQRLAGGFRSGNFYSSPAVAYGRVYLGNTDGKVYSFVAATGQLAWTSTLPYWAYGSPGTAFGNVYATSFDGTVAAMDGRTGDRLWTRKLPFRSLSSATIIGHLVYVADMGDKSRPGHIYALDPRTGAIRWRFHDGEYHGPIVADNMLILPGFTTLYALRPRGLVNRRERQSGVSVRVVRRGDLGGQRRRYPRPACGWRSGCAPPVASCRRASTKGVRSIPATPASAASSSATATSGSSSSAVIATSLGHGWATTHAGRARESPVGRGHPAATVWVVGAVRQRRGSRAGRTAGTLSLP